MLEIAGLVVAGVSALGTLVQAYYAARNANKNVSRERIKIAEERASEPLQVGAKRVAEIIDEELLETLKKEIDIRCQKLIEAFRTEDISGKMREQQVEAARIQICSFLKEVMNFNNGSLPTKRLQNLWISNRCNGPD